MINDNIKNSNNKQNATSTSTNTAITAAINKEKGWNKPYLKKKKIRRKTEIPADIRSSILLTYIYFCQEKLQRKYQWQTWT